MSVGITSTPRSTQGSAAALLAPLSDHARDDGIERFHAIVSPENSPALAALRRLGAQGASHDGGLRFLLPVESTLSTALG